MQTGSFRGFDAAIYEPGILAITFNRPEKLNGLDQWIKRDLVETLTQAQMDDRVRVVVFAGRGGPSAPATTSAAAAATAATTLVPDIPGGPPHAHRHLRRPARPLPADRRAIRAIDKLTVAAINGIAIQTGFSLALACDFRIASTRGAHGQRDAPLRPAARRGRAVAAGAAPGRGRHDGLPHAQAHRAAPRRRWNSVSSTRSCAPDELLERSLSLARRAGERPAGRDAAPEAIALQRGRADVRAGPRRNRGQDGDQRPPRGLAGRHGRLAGQARTAFQRLAGTAAGGLTDGTRTRDGRWWYLMVRVAALRTFKILVEKHHDGYVAYPLGLRGGVVGQGGSYDEALADVTSAIRFHLETFGPGDLEEDPEILEAFVAEARVDVGAPVSR